MSPEQARRLSERFAECQVEWRILGDAGARDAFLAEALGPAADLASPPPAHLAGDGRGFTLGEALIVETGSLVLSGSNPSARRVAFLAETHFALVAEEATHETLGEFLATSLPAGAGGLRDRWGHQLTLITGPSRTADIEKVLVLGAHGPRRLVLGTIPATLLSARFGPSMPAGERAPFGPSASTEQHD